MQVVALATGDEVLLPYNLTIDTDDVLDYLYKLFRHFSDVFISFYFDDLYGVNFADIITQSGFCHNFNLAEAHRLLEVNQLPKVFNYSKNFLDQGQVVKYRIHSIKPTKPYPMRVSDFRSGLSSLIPQAGFSEPFDVNHHEKFTTQGFKHFIHSPFEMPTRTSMMHQSIVNHSMVIYLNPEKTIVDKTLENYKPKRL
jgi:hypothetical protein